MLKDIARMRPTRSPNQPKAAPPKAAPTKKAAVIHPIQPPTQALTAAGPAASTSAGTMLFNAGLANKGKIACS